MPIVSAPVAAGTDVDGSQHNALRQDLLQNHVHDGSSGPRIDHDNLTEAGQVMGGNFYDHTAIDAHINATTGVHGNVLYGGSANLLVQYGTQWPGWSGSGWANTTITFPVAFASAPNVVISAHQSTGVNAVVVFARSITAADFVAEVKGIPPNHDSVSNDTIDNTQIAWIAIGPRA